MAPPSVTHIGKYEILAELGRGGMGVVYRAEDKNIGREVAIKTLTDATPELRQRFLVEARAGAISHQNIVTVFDFGEQDGNPYIVMEYLQGDSLEKVLRGGQTLTLVEKLEIVRQVCEGLGYAHSKGVVHRDIKPANVMVLPNGRVKIVDFGIARLEAASGQTKTGSVIGTFHYISPERLKGDLSDGRADIWACGIMLYQMLTGVLPFAGEDVAALHKVVNEAFPPLSTHLSEYPKGLDQVLERALAKSPDDRYAAADEMAADIEGISEVLKRAQVGEMLSHVRALLDQEQLSAARPVLLELQRLDPQNGEIRKLLREVQERLARQQKSEQVRQTLNLAEEAVLGQRFADALDLYKQAGKIDPSTVGLTEKIEYVRALKEKVDKIASLQQQARDARQRSDFGKASMLLDEALLLDERNTDLRNDKVRLVQEQERAAKEGLRRRLKENGREKLSSRAFTEAIQNLREALQIDPTDGEAQQMFQEATSRQEEERRRKVIEQIVAEIQECIFRGELQRALDITHRALERLPAEAVLLRLRGETEKRLKDETSRRLVEETSMKVQELFFSDPQEALSSVQHALTQMPGEERLLALQESVVRKLKEENIALLLRQYLKYAQEAIDAKTFEKALSTLEEAELECGGRPEISSLKDYVRSETIRWDIERGLKEADALIAMENWEGALAVLRPVAQRTQDPSVDRRIKEIERRISDREAQLDEAKRKQTVKAALEDGEAMIEAGNLEGALSLLRPVAQKTQDPSVERRVRQIEAQLDEVKRKLEAVIARVQSLRERQPEEALQFLLSEPATVQQNSKLKEVRVQLERVVELRRVTREAVQKATELLAKKDLRGGMESLEAVRQAYGDSPDLADAIAAYKARRAPIATEMVGHSITEARQAILAKNGSLAVEELQRSADVLEFADASCQTDWKRLWQESAKSVDSRSVTGPIPIIVQTKGPSVAVLGAIAAVVLLVLGVVIYKLVAGGSAGGPAQALTYLQLNASPFAEVVSITGSKGNKMMLPAGEHVTPLWIDKVPQDTYTVVFKEADGTTRSQSCDLTKDNLCVPPPIDLSDSQIEEIVAGKR